MAAYDRLVADGATVTELHHSCEIDAESQTDLQGLKTKVIEAEALESSGLVEALVAYPKGAEKEEGDAAASSSAVKREAPPGLEEKGAEPDMETAVTSIIWLSGEVDYDPPSGLPVVALAVPATMNETPLDAPETAEAEEAAPAASKAEDEEKTEGAADPAAEKAEEEEAAMPAAAAQKSEEAAMPPAASAEKAEEAAASSAAGDLEAATAASAAEETEPAAGSPAEVEYFKQRESPPSKKKKKKKERDG